MDGLRLADVDVDDEDEGGNDTDADCKERLTVLPETPFETVVDPFLSFLIDTAFFLG